MFHVDTNANNIHIRTKRFTCDDNCYLLDAADRAPSRECKHYHTTFSASPTELHLNHTKVSTRFSRTQLCGRRTQHVSARAIYEISVELFIPTPIPNSPPSLCLSLSPLSLQHLSHLIFPNTAAFLLYYFDESLTVFLPHHSPSLSAPPFLLTTFASPPLSMPTLANTHSVTFAHDREL